MADEARAVTVEDELKFAVHGLFRLPDLRTVHPAPDPHTPGEPKELEVVDDSDRAEEAALDADGHDNGHDANGHDDAHAAGGPLEGRHRPADSGEVAEVLTGPALTLRATYYDTKDLRLARSGITLRHRTGEISPTWHLKLPVGGAGGSDGRLVRSEFAVRGPAGPPPVTLTELVTAYVRSAPLSPVAVLRTARQVYYLRSPAGEEVAELVDDTVSVLQGRRVAARFREIEVELRGLSERAAREVGYRLRAAGAVTGGDSPKVVTALGPGATAAPDVPGPRRVRRRDPAAVLVAEALRAALRRLQRADANVRVGEHDAVHQMRVACRRMRSDLRTFAPLVEQEWAEQLRAELSWLANSLGDARDLEVLRVRVSRTGHADPLAPLDEDALGRLDALLASREQVAQERVRAALADPRYIRLLDALVAAAREPWATTVAAEPCQQVLPPLVAATWEDLSRAVSRLRRKSPDTRWHAARIHAKRARYAAEAVAPALGASATRRAEAATALQEILGEHQDAAVAAAICLDVAAAALHEHPPDVALGLTAARLSERERAAVLAARAALPRAWKAAQSPGVLRWLA
jgi:CHAD domain-containing protein